MSPVRRRPMLVLTDLLTSWKTSEKLKLRSRLSDTSMLFGGVSIREFFLSTLTTCSTVILGSGLYKDWIFNHQSEDVSLDNSRDEWSSVVRAIEDAVPMYESTSEWISLVLSLLLILASLTIYFGGH